jgi:hypothetical protein
LRAGLESEQANTSTREILAGKKFRINTRSISQKPKELQTQIECIEAVLSEKESVNESLRKHYGKSCRKTGGESTTGCPNAGFKEANNGTSCRSSGDPLPFLWMGIG